MAIRCCLINHLKVNTMTVKINGLIKRRPALCYFILTFFISWTGAFIVVASKVINGITIPRLDGILMFPVMLLGPPSASIILTRIIDGKQGVRNMLSRMGIWKVSFRWYLLILLLPPTLILIALLFLKNWVSLAFTPNFALTGIFYAIPAGLFEEIGWTGFAFPKLRLKNNFVKSGLLLGILWGFWHLPVIDFLGGAFPHGKYLILFFIAFIVLMTAVRIIISWIYTNTGSILLAQLMHIISTGSLAIFSPTGVSPIQEASWYFLYAALFWVVVLIILLINKKRKKLK